jgi:hypothetical protein
MNLQRLPVTHYEGGDDEQKVDRHKTAWIGKTLLLVEELEIG